MAAGVATNVWRWMLFNPPSFCLQKIHQRSDAANLALDITGMVRHHFYVCHCCRDQTLRGIDSLLRVHGRHYDGGGDRRSAYGAGV